MGAELLDLYSLEGDREKLAEERDGLVVAANTLVIDTPDALGNADIFLVSVATAIKAVRAKFKNPVAKAHEAHRALTLWRAELLDPLEEADAAVRVKTRAFRRKLEDDRKAREDALRRQEQARAERERQAEVDRQKAESDRLAAEAAALAAERPDEAEAKLAEAQARQDEAVATAAAPVIPTPIIVQSEAPKTKGVSMRTTWKHRVIDINLIPRQYMLVNSAALAQMARSLKSAAVDSVPGVEFFPEESEAVRGR